MSNCSWLIYYLGKNFEDEFLSVAIELGYPVLSQKWMKLVLLLCGKNQMLQQMLKELLRDIYLIFLGNRLIAPESCITKLGQNLVPSKSDLIILNDHKFTFRPNYWIKF